MKIKRLLIVAIFLFISLSCSLLTRAGEQFSPTDTIVPTRTSSPVPLTPEIYIPPQCEGQPVATLAPEVTSAQPTPSLEPNPPLTKEEQLDVLDELVAQINEVYLYPDFNGVDWDAVVADYRARVGQGLDTETFYTEMENLVMELGDEHSQFESPAQVAQSEARTRRAGMILSASAR